MRDMGFFMTNIRELKYFTLFPQYACSLSSSDVHIWHFSLDQFYWCIEKLKNNLSSEENERVNSFPFFRDRVHYQTIHGLLREILGLYLNIPPISFKFYSGPYGKPYIDPSLNSIGFYFNISHSNGIAVVGITLRREIGVDIEEIHKMSDMESLVQTQFTDYEKKKFYLLSNNQKLPFFYSCWVRKEALLKAISVGIGNDLSRLNVMYHNTKIEKVIDAPNVEGRTQEWLLKDISLMDNVKCALCVEGKKYHLSLIQLNSHDF